jgi:hypothetical protein
MVKVVKDGKCYLRELELGKMHELEVYYSKGGINYFTGNTNPRGVYVSITPVDIGTHHKSFTLLGENSGMKMLLEVLERKSAKRVFHWFNRIEPHYQQAVDICKAKGVREGLTYIKLALGVTI